MHCIPTFLCDQAKSAVDPVRAHCSDNHMFCAQIVLDHVLLLYMLHFVINMPASSDVSLILDESALMHAFHYACLAG